MQPSCMGMILALVLSACLAAAASGCDYPEAGCFAVAGYNEAGDVLFFNPFMVEELTDDSSMTVGFTVLLPGDGELIEVPLANGEDITRRYWQLSIANADSGAGSIDVELSHSAGRMSVFGGYQPDEALAGYDVFCQLVPVDEEVSLLSCEDVTRLLAGYTEGLTAIRIIPVAPADFEARLGMPVAEAERTAAQGVEPFEAVEIPPAIAAKPEETPEEPEEKPKEKDRPKPRPGLGGRGGARPR